MFLSEIQSQGKPCLLGSMLLSRHHPPTTSSNSATHAPPSHWSPFKEVSTHFAGGPLCIILPLLHGCGQLIHGADEDVARLAQTLIWAAGGAPIDLKEPKK